MVAGCADHVASAYVAGIRQDGDVLIKFGGAGDILLAAGRPQPDPRLFLDYHIVPGLFMPNGCMACSGAMLDWIVHLRQRPRPTPRRPARRPPASRSLGRELPPGADGLILLPYFLGEKTPIHDPYARGTLIGLGLHHTLGHIWRAALEAIVFGFSHHLEVFEELGKPARRVIASDGGAQSRLWMQIAAECSASRSSYSRVTRARASVPRMSQRSGSGRWTTGIRSRASCDLPAIVEPEPSTAGAYENAYGLFRETYQRLKPLYPKLQAPHG